MMQYMENTVDQTPSLSTFERLYQVVAGRMGSAAVYVAAKLRLSDYLVNGPKSCADLASITGTDKQSLYRLMRALSSIGIYEELDHEHFALTDIAEAMCSEVKNSMRDLILMACGDWYWNAWGNLFDTVKTGEPYFNKDFGNDFYTYLKEKPEFAETFNKAMASHASLCDIAITNAYDFSKFSTLVDLGCGTGGLALSIMKQSADIKIILCDLAAAIDGAKKIIEHEYLSSRVQFVEGDIFNSNIIASDCYVIKHVLHCKTYDESVSLLKKVKLSMLPQGKLLIIERFIAPRNTPSYTKFNDLGIMLLHKSSGERTEAEYREIIDHSGFSVVEVLHVEMGISIIIAE